MSEGVSAGQGPTRVGRFEILSELGRGAMGVVYEAHDPSLGRTIALKTIRPALGGPQDREAFEARFFAEAKVAARLQHPGIVVVHDVGRDPETGTLFIALEHLKGRTLADLTDGGRSVAWREAARILARVARALHHAHTEGVVHRDMKPANVMVLPSGDTKIMDFGIAKIEASLHHLTAPGEFLGTPLYMAPEQAQGGTITARTDVFALGAIGFTLVTGRPAFLGETVARIVMRVVNEDPGAPSLIAPSVPPELDGILLRALHKDPEARYADALALAEDLEALLDGRSLRHLGGDGTARPGSDVELVVADDPLQEALHALVPDEPPPTHTLARSSPGAAALPVPPPSRRLRFTRGLLLVGLGVLGGALVTRLFVNPEEPADPSREPSRTPAGTTLPSPSHIASEAAVSPGATMPPSLAVAAAEPGKLAIDFEHPLRSGLLRIWLDDELIVEQRLAGQAAKTALVFPVRKGSYKDVLEVRPGRHALRVRVSWEDNDKSDRIAGVFKAGATRRLQVRLGRLRKNLSLEWE